MENIKTTVEGLLRSLKEKSGRPSGENPDEILKKLLTKNELSHIRVNYFKKGVLDIKVDSSVWLYYLNLQKAKLLLGLGQHIDSIQDIRFRLGETKR